LTGEIEAFIL
jgi:hypothetical protein